MVCKTNAVNNTFGAYQTQEESAEFSQLWSVIEQVLQQDFQGNSLEHTLPVGSGNGARNSQKVFLERRTTTLQWSEVRSGAQEHQNCENSAKPAVTVNTHYESKQSSAEKKRRL